jgi:hypothetical protein
MARRSNLGIARKLTKDINKNLASQVQSAAVEITNGLAQAGPAWSGAFSAAWDVVEAGQSGSPSRGTGRVYRYDKRNFPLSRFENALERGRTRFEIVNSSPYADIAIDREESVFIAIGEPVGEIVKQGFRPKSGDGEQEPNLRGDVAMGHTQEEPNASITAELDWFETYASGGGLQRDLRYGASRAQVRSGI